jgi:hypothetical protein
MANIITRSTGDAVFDFDKLKQLNALLVIPPTAYNKIMKASHQTTTMANMANLTIVCPSAAVFDFDKLKLVDNPDSPRNTGRTIPQTLEGCEGCIKALPLKVCFSHEMASV